MNDLAIVIEMAIKYIVVMVLMMTFTGTILLVLNAVIGYIF